MNANHFKKSVLTTALMAAVMVSNVHASNDKKHNKSIEVITVTGEKVERSLKETVSSISVISAEELADGKHLTLVDALAEVANVVVLSGAVPDIRGVTGNGSATGFNSFTGGARSRISTLVDGVEQPFVADRTGDTGLWDIQQVEVFRGPQSTNNGRNSIGGSVFVKTNEASFDFGGAARLGYRDQSSFVDAAVAVTGPLIEDTLAVRVSAQKIDGETNNEVMEHATNPSRYDLNELKVNNIRSKFLLQPTQSDDLQIRLNYAHLSEEGNTGRNYFSGDDPWAYMPVNPRHISTESDTISLDLDYKISDDYSIDLLVSSQDYEWQMDTYEAVPQREQVVTMENTGQNVDARFNFGQASTRLTGFIGVQLEKREQDFVATGAFPYHGDDKSEYKALYGEVDVSLFDGLHLITGGRFQQESQKRNFVANFPSRDGNGNPILLPVDELLDNDQDITLPKIAVRWDLSPQTSAFASARKGYNAGGGALQFSTLTYYYYDEESVNTYEIGARTSMDDGNINLNISAFYNDFSDYQGTDSTRRITNVDEATTQGLEFEFNAMLTDFVQLDGGIGLLRSEITAADVAFGDVVGNELNSAPEVTASLASKFWLSDDFTLSLAANYVSEYFGDIANTKERVAGDYTLFRLAADYSIGDVRISGFVNNAFDKQATTLNQPADRDYPQGYAAIVEPRNMGISVTYSF